MPAADTEPRPHDAPVSVPPFLANGGEMARLIAAFDWAATPLGAIGDWPASLRMAVGMMLPSPIAMTLLWGQSGVMLYNDAYAVISGGRHPAILGRGVAEAWPEVADYNLPILAAGLAGQSLSFTNRQLTLRRHDAPEDVWLDVGYSPVTDDGGKPGGVLAVVVETTARNLADERLRIAQAAGRFGTFEWFPETHRLIASDAYREIYGLGGLGPDQEMTDATLLDLVVPDDRERSGIRRFGRPGNPLRYEEYRIRRPADGTLRWIARRGEILPGAAGAPQRYIGVAWDITEKKAAELQESCIAALNDRLRDIADAREAVRIASEMLGGFLAAGRVGYGEVEADATHVTVAGDWTDGSLVSVAGRHAVAAFGAPIVAALRRGETIRTDDVATDPRLAAAGVADAYAAIGMRAGLTVPLIRDGRFAGVLFAHCATPHSWSDGDEALMHAVAERLWDSAQRAQAEQRLRDSEANFRLLAEALPNHVWVSNPAGQVIWVNEQAYAYTGAASGDLQRTDWHRLVHPDDVKTSAEAWGRAFRESVAADYEHRIRRRDGVYRWHLVRVLPIRDGDQQVVRWIGTNTDIEEQKRALADLARLNATLEERVTTRTRALHEAEAALRQAQKMEAIGQLTGGIAHDFNNLLTGIIGSLDLVRRRLARFFPTGDKRLDELDRFMEAATGSAHRAASLTHRLLAFARRQSLDTRPVDVAALMHGMADLLRRALGEQVNLAIETPDDGWHVLSDPNQLESALLNLAINARDAMPAGGRLTIASENITLAASADLEAGAYVAISVTDTGMGMPDEVREKAFDPFFTTKPIGQGTGLGLSMVYGFARQSGGDVRIASTVGAGTTVTLVLPRSAASPSQESKPSAAAPRGAGETVLVVEDVAAVRLLVVEVLRDLGYRALEAADATEAMPILAAPGTIDLLVSDIGLPGMNGRQLADHARARRPGLKVLFVTGYAEDETLRGGGVAMITKPFTFEQLAVKIGEMMTGKAEK